jgi:hypothetical protein
MHDRPWSLENAARARSRLPGAAPTEVVVQLVLRTYTPS